MSPYSVYFEIKHQKWSTCVSLLSICRSKAEMWLQSWPHISISPNSTCWVKTRHCRHDTTSTTYRASRDVMWRAVSCVLRSACSNMADDEEAVLACKTISCIIYYLLFQLTNEINSFIETNYVNHNFIHITNTIKLRIAPVALVVTRTCRACCTACATQHIRLFPIPKCMG